MQPDVAGARGNNLSVDAVRPLPAELFRLEGFSSEKEHGLLRRAGVGLRTGEPRVTSIEQAVLVPAAVARGSHRTRTHRGGVLDRHGSPVASANLSRGGGTVLYGLLESESEAPVVELDEEVIYLGWMIPHHYGHFLLESLSRAWVLQVSEPAMRVAFLRQQPGPIIESNARMLELLGIGPERLVIIDQPTRVRRLWVPDPLYELFGSAHSRMVEPFHAMAERALGGVAVEPSEQPLYLSRRSWQVNRRPIAGEAELEAVLQASGVAVVSPQDRPLDDQIRLFHRHRQIVTCAGSASHTVLFSWTRPHLHVFSDAGVTTDYCLVSALAEAPTTLACCLSGDGGASAPRVLDVERALTSLADAGVAVAPLDAAMHRRLESVQAQFMASRAYAAMRGAATAPGNAPPELETEVAALSVRSWPLCWALAWYYAPRDPAASVEAAERFLVLARQEQDRLLLQSYRLEIQQGASPVVDALAAQRGRAAATRFIESLSAIFAPHPAVLRRLTTRAAQPGLPA